MSATRNLTEAQRWLRQALPDRDAVRLNRDHGFNDQLYIPTRYPNRLSDNVPHDFYDRTLADQALADLDAVLECAQRFVST